MAKLKIPKNLGFCFEDFCKKCEHCKLKKSQVMGLYGISCKHIDACRDLYKRIMGDKNRRAEFDVDFAEWLSTDRFHYCKCSACYTEFSEEMFYDNPPFRFCPWCGTPIKEEGDDEGGNGEE